MVSSAGAEAVELASSAGLNLYDWQSWWLENALAERADADWCAKETVLITGRQAGKNIVLAALELAALFIIGDPLTVHSAHEVPTAMNHFQLMLRLIDSTPDLSRKCLRPVMTNGREAIRLRSGPVLQFRARGKNSGRGLTAGRLVFDEAFKIPAESMGALLPTMRAMPNTQITYASSAPKADSTVLHGLVRRGRSVDDGDRLFYADWGNPTGTALDDVDAWYRANPSLGLGDMSESAIHDEYRSLVSGGDDELVAEFSREAVGIGEYPIEAAPVEAKLPADKWQAVTVTRTKAPHLNPGEVVLGFDVVDGWASIAIAAGTLARSYVECIEHHSGSSWLPARLVALVKRWKPPAVALDGGNGPAVAVLGEIREAFQLEGLDPDLVKPLTSAQYKAACGAFYTAVDDLKVTRPRFADDEPDQLKVAGEKAVERRIGEAFVWDRRLTLVPLSPLVSVTCARSLLSEVALSTEMLSGSLMA